ncbi:hypothetical protein ScPMuIL_012319 [Solemya velum]
MIYAHPCDGVHCNHGTCVNCVLNPNDCENGQEYECDCDDCWTGEFCDTELCPAGQSSPSGNTPCNLCERGEYQDECGQQDCKPCPVGMTSPPGSDDESDCYNPCDGVDCNHGTCVNCVLTPDECTTNQEYECDCDNCWTGEFCDTELCPAGQSSLSGNTPCNLCERGEYQDECGQQDCKPCPVGMTSPPGSDDESDCYKLCPAGQSSLSGNTPCNLCERGEYQDECGQQDCKPCPVGMTSPPGSDDESDCYKLCPAGQSSLSGNTPCNLCERGEYQDECGQQDCKPCPVGMTSPPGSDDESDCYKLCPAGQSSLSGNTPCNLCERGEYQDECGQQDCKPCPVGMTSPPGSDDESDCYKLCPAGQSSLSGNTPCNLCERGEYQDECGQQDCKPCPVGMTSPPGSDDESDCYNPCDGVDCNHGTCVNCVLTPDECTTNQEYECDCDNCWTGEFCDTELCPAGQSSPSGNTPCNLCERGEYQDECGQQDCKPCPVGMTSPPGSDDESDCYIPCDGIDCNHGTCVNCVLTPDKCTTNQEYECDCDNCWTGEFCDIELCPAGQSSLSGNTPCNLCERGEYQDECGQQDCKPCPVGMTSPPGSDDESDCYKLCPAGQSSPSGNMPCNPCGAGTYQDECGQQDCKPCPVGMTSPPESDSESDFPCDGIDCNHGTCVNCVLTPDKCTTNQEYECDCDNCWTGEFCDIELCPAGQSSPSGNMPCNPCGAGTYQDECGQQDCKPCPVGMTSPPESDSESDFPCDGIDCNHGTCVNCVLTPDKCTTNQEYECDCDNCWTGEFCDIELCPAGQSSPSGNTPCNPCERGEYQDECGQQDCKPCPVGMTSPPGSDDESDCYKLCPAGQSSPSGNMPCNPCGAGTYQDECGQQDCKPCPVGMTSPPESDSESDFPCDGIDCNHGTCVNCVLTPDKCTTNQEYECDCDNCWTGEFCDIELCPAGQSSPSGNTPCNPCERGEYQDECGQQDCKPCPVGMTSPPGSDDESDCYKLCPAGQSSPSGNMPCNPCGAGTYQDECGQQDCKPCPVGMTSPPESDSESDFPCDGIDCNHGTCVNCVLTPDKCTTNQEYECDCDNCWTGEFCDIELCPAGQSSPSGNTPCNPCERGEYQDECGQQDCKPCPVGMTSPPGSDDESDCYKLCPAGQSSPSGNMPCNPCGAGTYQDECGQQDCKPCPVGMTSPPESDSESDFPCDGIDCNHGTCVNCVLTPDKCTTNQEYECDCDNCWTGEFCDIELCPAGQSSPSGNTPCNPCERGEYQDECGQQDCKPCPVGMTSPPGSDDESDCYKLCPAGQSSPSGNMPCNPCGAGTYQDECGQQDCKPCPVGMTSPPESDSESDFPCDGIDCNHGTCVNCVLTPDKCTTNQEYECDCDNCWTGEFCDIELCPAGQSSPSGNTPCNPCERGEYQDECGQQDCKPCPVGMTSPPGSDDESDCYKLCPAGQSSPSGNMPCNPCGAGTYQDECGQQDCKPCPVGMTSPPESDSESDFPCDGIDCNHGTCVNCVLTPDKCTTNQEYECDCDNCWTGEFCDIELCPAGQSSPSGNTPCNPCERGEYQDECGQQDCKPCPVGMTSPPGSDDESDCYNPCDGVDCNHGTCVNCVLTPDECTTNQEYECDCDDCWTGEFCDTELCPAGQSSPSGNTPCNPCERGEYQDECGQQDCKPCPVGMTSPLGSDSESDCYKLCPAGQSSPSGNTPCNPCERGEYQDECGQQDCKPCPVGMTSPLGSDSESDCYKLCPAGQSSPSGNTPCNPCERGEYQDECGQQDCKPCPVGMTSPLGSDSESDCYKLCPAGQSSPSGNTPCNPCERGEYQDECGQQDCKPCPVGMTSPLGSDSESDCYKLCPAGQSSPSGNTPCNPCERGEYQDECGQQDCKPCPVGMTSPLGSDSESDCYNPCDGVDCNHGTCVNCVLTPDECTTNEEYECDCDNCWTGEFCDTELCPAGQSSPSGNMPCNPCGAGTYQDECGQQDCKPCPVGMTSPPGSDSISDCFNCGDKYGGSWKTLDVTISPSCYSFCGKEKTFEKAEARCEAKGGKMVTIETAAENDMIFDYIARHGQHHSWTGLQLIHHDDKTFDMYWYAFPNKPVTYDNFVRKPDNHRSNEACVQIRADTGEWNDVPCKKKYRCICEITLE